MRRRPSEPHPEARPAVGVAVSLTEAFLTQAAEDPTKIAVRCDGVEVTYGELAARVRETADALPRDVPGGSLPHEPTIGLLMSPRVEFLEIFLASALAGAPVEILQTTWPVRTLASALAQRRPQVAFCDETNSALLHAAAYDGDIVELADDGDALRGWVAGRNRVREGLRGVSETAPLLVGFTSGTTGEPKGFVRTHRSWTRTFDRTTRELGFSTTDHILVPGSLDFSHFLYAAVHGLCLGATVYLMGVFDPERVFRCLVDHPVNRMYVVPAMFRALLDAAPACPETRDPSALTGVESILSSGAKWDAGLTADAVRLFTEADVIEFYGASELSFVSVVRARDDAPPASVGRPFSGVEISIRSPAGEEVAPGESGVLYVRSDMLFSGYLDPAASGASFDDDGWLTVGDVARRDEHGYLYLIGRLGSMIITSGLNVYPEEVEAVLRELPEVQDAVVAGLPDRERGEIVAAAVEWTPRARLDEAELLGHCRARLPPYKCPRRFYSFAHFPRGASGKPDRKAICAELAARSAPPAPSRDDYVAPATRAEETLAAIWAEVMGLERVGVRDNFLELGGDSIVAIQVSARAHRAGLPVTPRQVLAHRTVEELAAAAGALSGPAPSRPDTGPAPLAPMQHWFLDRSSGDPNHFNQSVLLDCPEELDHAMAERLVAALVDRHEALRMRFEHRDGLWRQCPAAHEGAPLCLAFDASSPADVQAAVSQVHESLDLVRGPVVRAGLIRSVTGSRRLLIAAHHLVVDAVSWAILLDDLDVAYAALSRGEPAELPPPTASFSQWARALCDFAASGGADAELGYWSAQLDDVAPLRRDFDGGANTYGSADEVVVELDVTRTGWLLRDAPRHRLAPNEALLVALCQALASFNGDGAVAVEVESHGRNELLDGFDLTRAVGWFTSLFPLRVELDDSADARACVRAVKQALRRVPRDGVGYGVLRYLGAGERARELRRRPGPEVVFNYLGASDWTRRSPAGFASLPPGDGAVDPAATRRHALAVEAKVAAGRLSVHFSYSRDVHRRSSIARLAEAFKGAVAGLAAQLDAAPPLYVPGDFPLAGLDQAALDEFFGEAAE